ncbi:hypothetical protein [Pseudomonas sp. LjRoot277]
MESGARNVVVETMGGNHRTLKELVESYGSDS